MTVYKMSLIFDHWEGRVLFRWVVWDDGYKEYDSER